MADKVVVVTLTLLVDGRSEPLKLTVPAVTTPDEARQAGALFGEALTSVLTRKLGQ